MEGVIPAMNGFKRPGADIEGSPAKKTTFVGLSPLNKLTNVKTPTDRPFRVSIEGNIGAGKSTLIEYFKHIQGIETYAEPIEWWRNVDGHNLLDLMYNDIYEWLRVFQSFVLFTRLKTQTSLPSSSSTTVQMFERSIQNNRFCFLEQTYRSGYLDGADYAVLDQWYRWIRANEDISLDLIVYLRSTPELVYQRVKQRARPEENGLSLKYLQELHESHERWLMSDDERFNTIPVLVLDADKTLEDVIEQYKLNEKRILGHRTRKLLFASMHETEMQGLRLLCRLSLLCKQYYLKIKSVKSIISLHHGVKFWLFDVHIDSEKINGHDKQRRPLVQPEDKEKVKKSLNF